MQLNIAIHSTPHKISLTIVCLFGFKYVCSMACNTLMLVDTQVQKADLHTESKLAGK